MDTTGVRIRVLALEELMKVISEVGRETEDTSHKAVLKALYNAAKERHEFLKVAQPDEQ